MISTCWNIIYFVNIAIEKKIVVQKIEEWARILTTLTGAMSANIAERTLPAPLNERAPGSFLWPLGKQLAQVSIREKETHSPMDRRHSNTFRQSYLDNQYLVRSNASIPEMPEPTVDDPTASKHEHR